MNTTEIKETFYKRFGTSGDFLHYTFTGASCALLGHSGSARLSCALSMGVGMFARRLGGNVIKIQDIASDRVFSYIPHTPPALFRGREKKIAEIICSLDKYDLRGAQILYSSAIPKFVPQDEEFRRTLIRSLMKVSDIDGDIPLTPYPKSGYCIFTSDIVTKDYPLPLTGYKLVMMYCRQKEYQKKPSACLNHAAGERLRIEAAAQRLRGLSIKGLFHAMNASQSSMERHSLLRAEPLFLARHAKSIAGVVAARCSENGVLMAVENNAVDYAVSMIRNDFENNIGYAPTFCVTEAI